MVGRVGEREVGRVLGRIIGKMVEREEEDGTLLEWVLGKVMGKMARS